MGCGNPNLSLSPPGRGEGEGVPFTALIGLDAFALASKKAHA